MKRMKDDNWDDRGITTISKGKSARKEEESMLVNPPPHHPTIRTHNQYLYRKARMIHSKFGSIPFQRRIRRVRE